VEAEWVMSFWNDRTICTLFSVFFQPLSGEDEKKVHFGGRKWYPKGGAFS